DVDGEVIPEVTWIGGGPPGVVSLPNAPQELNDNLCRGAMGLWYVRSRPVNWDLTRGHDMVQYRLVGDVLFETHDKLVKLQSLSVKTRSFELALYPTQVGGDRGPRHRACPIGSKQDHAVVLKEIKNRPQGVGVCRRSEKAIKNVVCSE